MLFPFRFFLLGSGNLAYATIFSVPRASSSCSDDGAMILFLFQIDWGEGNDGPPPLGVDHEFPALLDCLKIRRHPVELKESILLDVNLMAAGGVYQPHCLRIHSHDHAADGVVV